jgi:DNA-directed RNA polymerase subunit RPC12/RpoP
MEAKCPKCNSKDLYADKKGFSGRKAVFGGLLTGGIGLLAGTLGSNKILITCLNCGNKFTPGIQHKTFGSTFNSSNDSRAKYVLMSVMSFILFLACIPSIFSIIFLTTTCISIYLAVTFRNKSLEDQKK